MNQDSDRSDRTLRRMLHELPLRRAPATLEKRVLEELERRAARGWWRRGFPHWPPGARASFVLICTMIIAGSLLGGIWIPSPAAAALSPTIDIALRVVHFMPPNWFYGAAAAAAALYAALFGLGAAAYRTLYRTPLSRGPCP